MAGMKRRKAFSTGRAYEKDHVTFDAVRSEDVIEHVFAKRGVDLSGAYRNVFFSVNNDGAWELFRKSVCCL